MDNFFQSCPAKMNDGRFLQDFRSSNTRELHNMHKQRINRSDDYRLALMRKGSKIMDNNWSHMRRRFGCRQNGCYHNYPTRSTPSMLQKEMRSYTNCMSQRQCKGPRCESFPDYRATMTPMSNRR